MTKRVIVLVVLLCVAPVSILAQKADVAFVAGASFTSDSNLRVQCLISIPPCLIPIDTLGAIHPDHHVFFQGNLGVRLIDAKLASLHLEVPVAGIPSQTVRFGFSQIVAPIPSIAIDHLSSVYVTPAIKVKLFPSAQFSPWGSVGGGLAHFSTDSGITTNKGAIQYGGGVDFKSGIPLLGLRAEVRDFLTGDPHVGAPLPILPVTTEGGLHRHNVLVGGGVVLRF